MENNIEKWVPIVGWEGIYSVSDYGRVKRLELITANNIRMPEAFKKFETVDGGYFRVQLVKRPHEKKFMVSRLVATHFIPNPDNKPEVNHKDGDKSNNRVSNLEWVTEKENVVHAFKSGIKNALAPKRAIMSDMLVMEIFISKLSLKRVSIKYGIPKLTVQAIKSGKRYGRVTGKTYMGKNGRALIYGT